MCTNFNHLIGSVPDADMLYRSGGTAMRLKRGMLTILLGVAVLLFASPAAATSWADVPPEEVVERADVTVLGRYDLESKAQDGSGIFVGYPFTVEKVYKGKAPSVVTAGIDGHDIGWVDDYQSGGGQFLLFLEQSESYPFLVPVGGPNGMIRLVGGRIDPDMGEEAAFFQHYLDQTQPNRPDPTGDQASRPDDTGWLVVLFVLSGSAVLLFGYRIVQMRKNDSP